MRFVTDATLGKLGRHLRAAGFDTLCQHRSGRIDFFDMIDAGRVILTRTTVVKRRFKCHPLIFIRDNDPLRQMIQVVRELRLGWGDVKPFSRCLACNTEIRPVDRDAVRARVPAYVWQHHQIFHACGQCQRIYWTGTHHDRMKERLVVIFQRKEENPDVH